MAEQTIYLGGGCFWCTEAVFTALRGVVDVESGYANGHVNNPSYEDVCRGNTGHAEVIRLRFDDARLSLDDVLGVFFATHDPTTPNRQGNDVGTQYRSAVYADQAATLDAARAFIARLEAEGAFDARLVTEVAPLTSYWAAEDYHQDYYERHPGQGYCAFVIGPKMAKFRKRYAELLA
jgi:peptide-methionine (S)-S-oxide reductase